MEIDMSETNPPGDPFEFLKKMWGPMGQSLPGMVTPTLDVNEIDKRIGELRSVETWLTMNLNMLKMTIQGLEMQRSTLAAFQSMGTAAQNVNAPAEPGAASPGIPPWPWNLMPQAAPVKPPEPAAPREGEPDAKQ
jgi:hypothetical protein